MRLIILYTLVMFVFVSLFFIILARVLFREPRHEPETYILKMSEWPTDLEGVGRVFTLETRTEDHKFKVLEILDNNEILVERVS